MKRRCGEGRNKELQYLLYFRFLFTLELLQKGYMGKLTEEPVDSIVQFPPTDTQVKVTHEVSESTEPTKNRANTTNSAHFILFLLSLQSEGR
jgi:hypothetical protein